MIVIGDKGIKAILRNHSFINKVSVNNTFLFNQTLDKLKCGFLDNFSLSEIDKVSLGTISRDPIVDLDDNTLKVVEGYELIDIDSMPLGTA